MQALASAAIWSCLVTSVLALATGAPEAACDTLQPAHGVVAQVTLSPYSYELSTDTIEKGGSVTVTLKGEEGFQGFLLVARDTNDNNIGNVAPSSDEAGNSYKIAPCSDASATHTGSEVKNNLEISWTAPADFTGQVCFMVTFAQTKDVWWGPSTGDCVNVTDTADEAEETTEESSPSTTQAAMAGGDDEEEGNSTSPSSESTTVPGNGSSVVSDSTLNNNATTTLNNEDTTTMNSEDTTTMKDEGTSTIPNNVDTPVTEESSGDTEDASSDETDTEGTADSSGNGAATIMSSQLCLLVAFLAL